MDTKLLTLDKCRQYPLQSGWFDELIKKVQRNAIEIAVQRCSKEAGADYVVLDDNVEKIHDETIECGIIPIEVYVTTSSILDCKQKLFEENNLI